MLRIHLAFILQKRALIILVASLLGFASLFVYYADLDNGYQILDSDRIGYMNIYMSDCLNLQKLLLPIIGILIATTAYSEPDCKYLVYLISDKKSKIRAVLTKPIAIALVELALVWFNLLAFYLVCTLFTPFPLSFLEAARLYSCLFLSMLFYSLLQSILVTLVKNFMVMLLPVALYFYLAEHDNYFQIDASPLLKIANSIVPNLVAYSDGYKFYADYPLYLITISFLYLVQILLHNAIDI